MCCPRRLIPLTLAPALFVIAQGRVPDPVRPNKPKRRSLEQSKVYGRAKQGEGLAHAPQNLEIPKGFQQSIFKSQVREEGLRVWDQLVHNSLIG